MAALHGGLRLIDSLSSTHLTRQTLYHCLPLRRHIVRPATPAEQPPEILAVRVVGVRLFALGGGVKGARVGQRAGGAVTAKVAFGEELELLVVRVTRDRAC